MPRMPRTPIIALVGALLAVAPLPGGWPMHQGDRAGGIGDRDTDGKALARRWFEEVINRRNLDAISGIYTADYVWHGPGGEELHGVEELRAFASAILAASNDRHAVVHQQVAESDLVVTGSRAGDTTPAPTAASSPPATSG